MQANVNLQNFDVALEDFKAVLEIDPENKAARNQITITNQKKKQLLEREKQLYSGMFQKLAASEPKVTWILLCIVVRCITHRRKCNCNVARVHVVYMGGDGK